MTNLELLIPAKDLATGVAAVNHGADTVYIGAPKFGARQAAGNSLQDIEQLVRYSHLYGAKVHVTLNTLLFDEELEDARSMAYRLYEMGIDALIIQDLGLLETGLPPVALHASTQCHNASVERVQFMEKLGFQRAILARELDLETIRKIRQQTNIELETFVHGALCVSYSGQCYMSSCATGRSGNRGACAQLCRYRYDLTDAEGKTLAASKYLLSLRDMNRSAFIADLAKAGICSLKVEGRLKDVTYVKNITSYYRQRIDAVLAGMPDIKPSGSGHVNFFFTPNPDKTFNRGYTDYFIQGKRSKMATLTTPKAMGEHLGILRQDSRGNLFYEGQATIANGDGLCFINDENTLEGFLVNRVEGAKVIPHKPVSSFRKVEVFRNVDKKFEDLLAGKTAERRIWIDWILDADEKGFALTVTDEDGCQAHVSTPIDLQFAQKPEMAARQLENALTKVGNTPFETRNVNVCDKFFIPTSQLNVLKKQALDNLEQARIQHFQPYEVDREMKKDNLFQEVTYKANVVNEAHRSIYTSFGAESVEDGLDKSRAFEGKELMVCKYCLRYEMGLCSKQPIGKIVRLPWFLSDGTHKYRLEFDCARCEMKVIKA
ncbi:MAG: U32 family peptidase [Bacteroidales bacterium]|nr:U32 family peptidase [Bacteroidales bacterium]